MQNNDIDKIGSQGELQRENQKEFTRCRMVAQEIKEAAICQIDDGLILI